jgi:hypothetical protein
VAEVPIYGNPLFAPSASVYSFVGIIASNGMAVKAI